MKGCILVTLRSWIDSTILIIELYSMLLRRWRTNRYSPVHNCRKFSAVLFLCIQEIVNGMKQPHWLGNDIAEQLHFQSTSRGFIDVDIHEYNWACRRRHSWSERAQWRFRRDDIKAMLTVWHALCHQPFCLFWPETGYCFVCPHDPKLLTRLPTTELGLFLKSLLVISKCL